MIPYSERKLTNVRMNMMDIAPFEPDGKLFMRFAFEIQFQAFDGDAEGPTVTLQIAAPINDEMTIQDFECAALTNAGELLQALRPISSDDLSVAFYATRASDKKDVQALASYRKGRDEAAA